METRRRSDSTKEWVDAVKSTGSTAVGLATQSPKPGELDPWKGARDLKGFLEQPAPLKL